MNLPGTHCLKAPYSDDAAGLYADWDGDPVEFDSNVPYRCERGAKFNISFEKTEENATCLEGNNWVHPANDSWPICVSSKCVCVCMPTYFTYLCIIYTQ